MEAALTIPFWLELMATIAGALSGSIHAVKHNYDFFGVVCLACITGLSGGIVRDILLQNYGIYAFQHWELIAACMVGAVPVFFFARLLGKLDLPMDIMDTISIALYAVIGAGKGVMVFFLQQFWELLRQLVADARAIWCFYVRRVFSSAARSMHRQRFWARLSIWRQSKWTCLRVMPPLSAWFRLSLCAL